MRRRDSHSTGPGQRTRINVRCRECAVRGAIDCAPYELVEALSALHSAECQEAHGVWGFERICVRAGCDNGAAPGKDYCGRCVAR
jgi:hypothetical protein